MSQNSYYFISNLVLSQEDEGAHKNTEMIIQIDEYMKEGMHNKIS